jgi:hypothetical protein
MANNNDPLASATLLRRRPTYDDVGKAAAFRLRLGPHNDRYEVNIAGGAVVDLQGLNDLGRGRIRGS